jgi:hypothetical protein
MSITEKFCSRVWSSLPQKFTQISALRFSRSYCIQHNFDQFQQSGPSTSNSEDTAKLRLALLNSAFGHVKKYGWTQAALEAAAAELSMSPASTGLIKR